MIGPNLRRLEWLLFQMQSPEDREALLKSQADKHAKLMRFVNTRFAVVIDGPRAGEIVSVSSGKRIGRGRIDTLTIKEATGPFAVRWLLDPQRRELTDVELTRIVARTGR